MTLVVAALLFSGLSNMSARTEETAVPKPSAYPQLAPPTSKPAVNAAEQEKLKKELSNAAARAKAKKP